MVGICEEGGKERKGTARPPRTTEIRRQARYYVHSRCLQSPPSPWDSITKTRWATLALGTHRSRSGRGREREMCPPAPRICITHHLHSARTKKTHRHTKAWRLISQRGSKKKLAMVGFSTIALATAQASWRLLITGQARGS